MDKKKERKMRFKSFKQKESVGNVRVGGEGEEGEETDLPDLKLVFDGQHYKVSLSLSLPLSLY